MDDRSRIIERVNALIERAVHESTPVEEARTSALIAVKEIKKHGLAVGTLVKVAPPPRASHYEHHNPWYDQRPPPTEKRFVVCGKCGVVREAGEPCKTCEDREADAARRAKQRAKETERRQTSAREAYQSSRGGGTRYKRLESRYAGKCKACGNLYTTGDDIAWVRDEGATHWDCREYWSQA
jgi:hypothetical protein